MFESANAVRLDLIEGFAETARRLYASEDLDETLGRIADAALRSVPACDMASVSVLEDGHINTHAATDTRARLADEVQYQLGEGPCLDAAHRTTLVFTPDLRSDPRWPNFGPRVADQLAVSSLISCRLSTAADRERIVGSLNLYGGDRRFTEEDCGVAMLLGIHASAVVSASLEKQQLRAAINSRDVIGQAKGILMERCKVTPDQAFDQLRMASQRMNVKLRELAARITETGELP